MAGPNGDSAPRPDEATAGEALASSIGKFLGEAGGIPQPADFSAPAPADPGSAPRLPYVERADPPDTGSSATGRAWEELG